MHIKEDSSGKVSGIQKHIWSTYCTCNTQVDVYHAGVMWSSESVKFLWGRNYNFRASCEYEMQCVRTGSMCHLY